MSAKLIGLSFKNNIEDMELYLWICTHSGVSAFIKDTLRQAKENDSHKNYKPITKEEIPVECDKVNELIDLDF